MESANKVVYRNTFYLYIMTGAKFILPLIITACLTRRLGPVSYGVISYLTPVMNCFILLFDFGFNFSATKKISQNRQDIKLINKTIAAVYTAKIILAAVGLVILLIMIPCINILKENIVITLFYYIATAVQIFVPDFLYRGIEKMEALTTRYILAKLITAVLIFFVVRGEQQLLLIPLFYLLGTGAAAVYTNWHMRRKLGYTVSLSGIRDAVLELKDSSIYFVSTFAGTALTGANAFVMGIVNMPLAQIAYWGVAFQVIQAAQSMYDPITTSIYPHVAAKKEHRFVLRIMGFLLPAVLLGCVLLYRLSDLAVIIIAGSEYLEAAAVLRYLMPLLLFSFIAQMLGFPFLGAVGRQKQVMITIVISAVFHLLGIMVLIISRSFSLFTLAILRNVSELMLMVLRIYYAAVFLKENRMRKTGETGNG